ncbi:hypothetical protein V8C43DRAFT_302779 [Trichoderma afarasin]
MMDELQGEHDCKIIQAIRELPLNDTINFCREWENTPLSSEPQGSRDFTGQPPNEQTVNPTNESTESESTESESTESESTESESTESSSSEDSGDDGDSEDDDDESEEDALTCLGLYLLLCVVFLYLDELPPST